MADQFVTEILGLRHPAYERYRERWERAERRLAGGEPVTEELTHFDWEEVDGAHHKKRKGRAVYLPLPHETARKFVDSIAREAPKPGEAHPDKSLSFGTLGTVRPALGGVRTEGSAPADEGTGITEATRAEMVWTNCDGTGDDGAPWDPWWDGVQRRAMSTGFRWVGVEAPRRKPVSQADEDRGLRPYAIEYSPLQTPYWHFSNGTLQVLHVELSERRPRLKDGKVTDEAETRHLLYVRAGFEGFGDRFKVGGWWVFTADGDPVMNETGEPAEGRWDSTGGAIPFTRFFYERDPRDVSGARSGLDEVGAIAVGLMDLESAARHDALVGGGRTIWAVGVGQNAHKTATDQLNGGSRFIGVPGDPSVTYSPTIHDMAAADASGAIEKEMDRLLAWAKQIATKELTTSPDASGVAKQVEYDAEVSPRLAHMARMREEAQAFVLRMFELRWGGANTSPSSAVRYPRRYSLEKALDVVLRAIEAITQAGASSATLITKAAEAAVVEAGLALTDEESAQVRQEIAASAEAAANRQQQARALEDDLLNL